MVVVVVIGVLVTVAIPIYNKSQAITEIRTCWGNQRTLEGLIQAYRADFSEVPSTVASLTASGYLRKAPLCPDEASGFHASTYTLTGEMVDPCSVASHGHY